MSIESESVLKVHSHGESPNQKTNKLLADRSIIIMFVLKSVFHACVGWMISYERLPTIPNFS